MSGSCGEISEEDGGCVDGLLGCSDVAKTHGAVQRPRSSGTTVLNLLLDCFLVFIWVMEA
jgi:hypothetical protein